MKKHIALLTALLLGSAADADMASRAADITALSYNAPPGFPQFRVPLNPGAFGIVETITLNGCDLYVRQTMYETDSSELALSAYQLDLGSTELVNEDDGKPYFCLNTDPQSPSNGGVAFESSVPATYMFLAEPAKQSPIHQWPKQTVTITGVRHTLFQQLNENTVAALATAIATYKRDFCAPSS